MRRTQTAPAPLKRRIQSSSHPFGESLTLRTFTDPIALSETFHSYGHITHGHTASAIVCSVRLKK
jgi:hypothetical protein